MLYAVDHHRNRIRAIPRSSALCPTCNKEVIAKCGNINIWHWAHRSLSDCDSWHKSETDWHLSWKAEFPEDWVEVSLSFNGEKHRADVLCDDGLVIEFQNSYLSPEDIYIREQFYNNMIWVFNIEECCKERIVGKYRWEDDYYTDANFKLTRKSGYQTFRWKHPRKFLSCVTKPCYLDMGNGVLLEVKKARCGTTPFTGWGHTIERKYFLRKFAGEF